MASITYRRDRTGRAFVSFVLVLGVVAAMVAFVVLPGATHTVQFVGDCTPPPPAQPPCVPPQVNVLVGDGNAGIRALVALVFLVAALVTYALVQRARRRAEALAT
jgi:hypothetical protein